MTLPKGCIFIPGNIPSSKNSKINTSRGSFMSKTVKKFLQFHGIQSYSLRRKEVKGYKTRPNTFEIYREHFENFKSKNDYPIKLGFHFIRRTRAQADFHNLCQILCDLFVAHDFIEDDSMDYLLPFPLNLEGKWYSYDKENPGVIITFIY